jgi:hypothetical protein
MTMTVIAFADPISNLIHCGSLKADDQRVVAFPSTAIAGVYDALSCEDAAVALTVCLISVGPGALPYTLKENSE